MYQFEVTTTKGEKHLINYFRAINFCDAEEILKEKGINEKVVNLHYLGNIPFSLSC